ncbi:putative Ig domain-containing protein [Aquirufa sp.]|uniref:putative Ig domain-containing protein n=1 Tax=Aquirufa sp. TaxID=2676249 RepID=UPI003782FD96
MTISPALPVGLVIDPVTGAISGTATATSAPRAYTVTATNAGGTGTDIITISIVEPSRPTITYQPANIKSFPVDSVITPWIPITTDVINSVTVTPALPAGLVIDPLTGIITGKPTAIMTKRDYIVTASNTAGSDTARISITVTQKAPTIVYNPTNKVFGKDLFGSYTPIVTGAPFTSVTTIPAALPEGLRIDSLGVIKGTPTQVSAPRAYTINVSNAGGTATTQVTLEVSADICPVTVSVSPSAIILTQGVVINPAITPTTTGVVSGFSLNPAIPAGLTFNPSSGAISGTPTGILTTTSFVMTAGNGTCSATGTFSMTINPKAPTIEYTPKNKTFGLNTPIAAFAPVITGAPVTVSIFPTLPAGLVLNTTTGAITGTPSATSAPTAYTVKAINSSGEDTDVITIEVTATVTCPDVNYNPNALVLEVAKDTTITPSQTGVINSFTISPALPAGLAFNTANGTISGKALAKLATKTFTVKAINSVCTDSTTITIQVKDKLPEIAYLVPSLVKINKNEARTFPLTSTGGAIDSLTIDKALPEGLVFNTKTGTISGTATAASPANTYTVKAFNESGFDIATIVIEVLEVGIAPTIEYPTKEYNYFKGDKVSILPTLWDNVQSATSSPTTLPGGLSLDPVNGKISGVAGYITVKTTYTITALNTAGTDTAKVIITVSPINPPDSLSYASPKSFIVNEQIIPLSPKVKGFVEKYEVSPVLPAGLVLDPKSGIITGKPSVISPESPYVITASNETGGTSFTLLISVTNPIAPELCYEVTSRTFNVGEKINTWKPTVKGAVNKVTISPNLPAGLTIDPVTGDITGTPTVKSAAKSYVVTSYNSAGEGKCTINITVVDSIAPSNLKYAKPISLKQGVKMSDLIPTYTGYIAKFTAAPGLPAGLSLDSTTGKISGTPTTPVTAASAVITGINSYGSTTDTLSITVAAIAPVDSVTYPSPLVFVRNERILPVSPTVVGGPATSFTMTPALPSGLQMDPLTGIISGTPIIYSPANSYAVTASNSVNSITTNISIRVDSVATLPPSDLYDSPITTYKGVQVEIKPKANTAKSFTISPSLPTGLDLDLFTGIIRGIPTKLSLLTKYVVVATNSAGSVRDTIELEVNNPPTINYPKKLSFNQNELIVPVAPVVEGGFVSGYSITPGLPAGLSIDATSGEITGTPTAISALSDYFISANDGVATDSVKIEVVTPRPPVISYPSPQVYDLRVEIKPLEPNVNGYVASYIVSPSLPAGLSIDPSTGIISGTPSALKSIATYIITARNAAGSDTARLVITVRTPVKPDSLEYPTPNTFIVGDPIETMKPKVKGGVSLFTVAPELPAGLSLDPSTGWVTGTPSIAKDSAIYVFTATNVSGSTSANVAITVINRPIEFDYTPTSVTFNRGELINPLSPRTAGIIDSIIVSPALPAGLTMDRKTGVISGKPQDLQDFKLYTFYATGPQGVVIDSLRIKVDNSAPCCIVYNSPNTFAKGVPINTLKPTYSGYIGSFSISPSLPAGLNFNQATGEITGTPTVLSDRTTYEVIGTNDLGSTKGEVVIAVTQLQVPQLPIYSTTKVTLTKGVKMVDLKPIVSGFVKTFIVTPALPAGISLDPATGIISGIPADTSALASFVITAENPAGKVSATLQIEVIAPDSLCCLAYRTPNTFNKGKLITPITPSVRGDVSSYTIKPALPQGLVFDPSSGIISGTPVNVMPITKYTVTASNAVNEVSASFTIQVVAGQKIKSISYPTPNVLTKGVTITPLSPTVLEKDAVADSYTISPNLPAGLSMDPFTGVISGKPTSLSDSTRYEVIASNDFGSVSTTLDITVIPMGPPQDLVYPTPNQFTHGLQITPLTPTYVGTVEAFSVSPALPAGLTLDPVTGVISGRPTAVSALADYQVTATNNSGSTQFTLQISVDSATVAPDSLSYPTPNVFGQDEEINPLIPKVKGAVYAYSVEPSLPAGINIDAVTGIISGTPIGVIEKSTFTVTARNNIGSVSADIEITILPPGPPDSLYYPPVPGYTGKKIKRTLNRGEKMNPLTPNVKGFVKSYSINPSLPAGLNFDGFTGVISGTPEDITELAEYVITAMNAQGSISDTLLLEVILPVSPDSLSYPSPHTFIQGVAVVPSILPTVNGFVRKYSIEPALPRGMTFDEITGEIAGTPLDTLAKTSFVVTATNSVGTATDSLEIEVVPPTITYNTPNRFKQGVEINPLEPTIVGKLISFSVSPALPKGIVLDSLTGIISGNPYLPRRDTTYVITGRLGDIIAKTKIRIVIDIDSLSDLDNDGYKDWEEIGANINVPVDTDKDGTADILDDDSDGDGITDRDERETIRPDCDEDGIDNRIDKDVCNPTPYQGISPNGDGLNETLMLFYDLDLKRNPPNRLTVINRYGQTVFVMDNYDNSWGGQSNQGSSLLAGDGLLPDGTYYYILDFFGEKPTVTNYVYINRLKGQ